MKWLCIVATGWNGQQIDGPCSTADCNEYCIISTLLQNCLQELLCPSFLSFTLLMCSHWATPVLAMPWYKHYYEPPLPIFSFSTCSWNSASLLPSVGSSLHLCRNQTISYSPSCNTQRTLHIYCDTLCAEILFPCWFFISHWCQRFEPTGQEHIAVLTLAASLSKLNK